MNTVIHTLKCKCGWNFLSLNKFTTKCPQCRDIINECVCCGKDISDREINAKYCVDCAVLTKKIYDKVAIVESRRRAVFKDIEFKICDYDCGNCKFSDCILPVDLDDINQGELFND